MNDIETERARAAAEDLVNLLSAYELELSALEQEAPGVASLREAIGTALAKVSFWISDRDAEHRRFTATVH
ncbi:hypothetical protein LJR219_002270 [Phenylobacterium sp. LjRoot219]|uniref:hypothetical protein n=1 Tax=Phenylobacterium sp. LjRoot219 TaxID=3342283 RepID=UPI003ED06E31